MDAKLNSDNELVGEFVHGDNTYKAKCDCSDSKVGGAASAEAKGPVCKITKPNVVEDRKMEGSLSLSQVKEMVGEADQLKLVDVENTSFKCLDGRHKVGILGTPGGDLGEFILGLMVYEDLLNKKLSQSEIEKYLRNYLQDMKQTMFSVCTDDQAVSHLESQASIEGLNIHAPEKDSIPDLMQRIVEPENNGDLHIRSMLKSPEEYFIRPEIVKGAISAFFKAYWNQDTPNHSKLQLIVLPGTHQEKAFVEVQIGKTCSKEGKAALVHTKKDKTEMFVNHRTAAQIRKKFIAKFFVVTINQNQDDISEKKMVERLEHHGNAQLETTGRRIAKKKSFFSVDLM